MAATTKVALTQADYKAKLETGAKIQSKDVATLPRPGTSSPSSIKFISDTTIAYLLPEDATSLTRHLYSVDVTTGEQKPVFHPDKEEREYSLEEQMRRERARMMATGVTSYQFCAATNTMLIPLGGALWLLQGDEPPRKLIETNTNPSKNDSSSLPLNASLLDAKLSSDGSTVAFVAEKEVYALSTVASSSVVGVGVPTQITSGARAREGHSNGVADYVAQEELERSDGFWLSPKGTRLVYEFVDESHIPPYRIMHQGEDKGLSSTLEAHKEDMVKASTVSFEEHRYPFAGTCNPKVKLGVTSTSATSCGDSVVWFDLERVFGDDFYLAKVEWLKAENTDGTDVDDSTKVVVQLLDRRQKKLALVLLDTTSGNMKTLHTEEAMEGAWINLNNSFHVLKQVDADGTMEFLWASERDGYRHLYVLEASLTKEGEGAAKVLHRLTGPGEFIVEDVLEVGDSNVYYMGTLPGKWLGKHLFRVSLKDDGSIPECLTESTKGQHSCVVNTKAGMFVDTVSSVDHPPTVSVRKLRDDGCPVVLKLHDASTADQRVVALGDALKAPTFHQFPSTDNKVTLQAAVYLPDESVYGKGPYPLVVATYGGPHVQYVQNTWGMMSADMRSQFLRANGFAVIKVDNRGSNRRGLVFEAPIWGNMGELEVADQVAGVEWAAKEGFADADRVAVSGWSYGGYMALKCLTDRPDVFHAAVSGAPVTDWTLYDTCFSERYMGLPQENVKGYAKASALANVGDIEGSLLLCHGLLDENVLFRQSAVLVNELVKEQKAYDLVLFPSERHGPRRPQDRAFLEERIVAFLQRSLGLK
jgi:dipeptidyl-peptidase-4